MTLPDFEKMVSDVRGYTPPADGVEVIVARHSYLLGLEKAKVALMTRRDFTVPDGCPDGLPGCCVAHFRTDNRVPMGREECIEAIQSAIDEARK